MSAPANPPGGEGHTKGPWSCFYKAKYDEWHVSLPIAGTSMKLALARDGIQSGNREADAHLIAAAPDLLAALVAVRARFQHLRLGPDEEAVLDRVGAAILRATARTKE